MNRAEYAINKPILREANIRFKDHSVGAKSQAASQADARSVQSKN